MRIGSVKNTPHAEIDRLRSQYKVNIRTFQKNTNHFGFAWFKTIYLNEKLWNMRPKNQTDPYYLLKWVFQHEYYHLLHKHKRNVLLMRFGFSLIPLLAAVIHWGIVVAIFVAVAYGMYYLKETVYEKKANEYANQKMNNDKANHKRKAKNSN